MDGDGRDACSAGSTTPRSERALRGADVLCAPSLGGESFGMVLTEAFAAGTPVVASDIAGYRDVVERRRRRRARPARRRRPRSPRRCATSRSTPARRASWPPAPPSSAERYAWPPVAGEVVEAYADARRRCPRPVGAVAPRRRARRPAPADGRPRAAPAACPRSSPRSAGRRRPALVRRAALGAAPAVAATSAAALAVQRIGLGRSAARSCAPSPSWVLLGLALMCASMLLRAVSWHAILKAALPRRAAAHRRRDAGHDDRRADEATLPARLGEPSRALIVARRLGRPRDRLPVVLGTLVSQTLLNVARAA